MESGIQLKESGTLLKIGIQNPNFTNSLESNTENPEFRAWNPESKTVLDSLTWGDSSLIVFPTAVTKGKKKERKKERKKTLCIAAVVVVFFFMSKVS